MNRIMMAAAALTTAGLLLAGCVAGARSTAMVAPVTDKTLVSASHPLHEALVVNAVTGGSETNPIWKSKVSSSNFRGALETSLNLTTMLAHDAGRFTVDADLVELDQPTLAINFDVKTTVRYTIRSRTDNSVVWRETIVTNYEAVFTDSFVRSERLRLANEGSVKTNIGQFIERLVQVSRQRPGLFAGS